MQSTNLRKALSLFEGYGIEIEYMIVERDSLEISPFTDQLFYKIAGVIENEIERGEIALNNELALHVVELKTNGPKQDFIRIADTFRQEVAMINKILWDENKILMPSAMHPWTTLEKILLWPHDDKTIYNTYHDIFNCQGHGWSNLQSTHLNLPFADESEFVKLHQAIRLVMPIIPAIAASSPLCEGKLSGYTCDRMVHYEANQKLIPMITGEVIPESVSCLSDYHDFILQPLYEAIKPYDTHNVLAFEWLNSRGAITRFDRNAIEIRVIDNQECPLADLAIVSAIVAVIKRIINGDSRYIQTPIHEKQLKHIMDACIKEGMAAKIDDKTFLNQLNLDESLDNCKMIWAELIEQEKDEIPVPLYDVLQVILKQGSLSERITKSLPKDFSQADIKDIYQKLTLCLNNNELYV